MELSLDAFGLIFIKIDMQVRQLFVQEKQEQRAGQKAYGRWHPGCARVQALRELY